MSKKKAKDKKQQVAYPAHTYRGKDVTGALGFVKSLFADLWDVMPEDQRPRTDREAAATYFQVDRAGYNMDEFLAQLQAHNVAELDRLSKESRKPPKRLVGFINMATGEKRPAFPDFLTMPASQYDKLLALIVWSDSTPACVELPDRAWESIHDTMVDCIELDEAQWPGVFVDSAQIETVETAQRNITPGTLVALLSHEDQDGDDTEHHCVLVRGNEDDE